MSQERDTIHAIAWLELFPSLHLVSAARMALNFRALILAAAAIVLTTAGWQTCGRVFSDTNNLELQQQIEQSRIWPWDRPLTFVRIEDLTTVRGWREEAPLLLAWREIRAPFVRIYRAEATLPEFAYAALCALWSLAVWAFFGGAITRQAAVSFARQENSDWGQLISFVLRRWGSYFAAPLFPILGTFLLAAFLAIVGLIARSSAGLLVAGVVWPIVLLVGFMMAFLLIVLFVGWPLMWNAISVEGTDAFGALSHSYSYSYQRPLHYLAYVVVAAFIGVLGFYLISIFAEWTIILSNWGVSWGSGGERMLEITNQSDTGAVADWGMTLVWFWSQCVVMLTLAFVFSYFWTASTVIYFLLRRLVDAKEMDEVTGEQHELHGLPPLKTGVDGVSEPADEVAVADDPERRED